MRLYNRIIVITLFLSSTVIIVNYLFIRFYLSTNPSLKSSEVFKKAMQTVCKDNQEQEYLITKVDLESLSTAQLRDLFYKFITKPSDGVCPNKQRIGGRFENIKCYDGHRYVCLNQNLLSDIEKNKCLVYSFGIKDDWTFEQGLRDIGCKVLAFDPSVDLPRELDTNIFFEKIGLGNWVRTTHTYRNTQTLSSIIRNHGHTHTNISYLKLDIEGSELDGLLEWFESGALSNVQQIAIEYHMEAEWIKSTPQWQYKTFLKGLQKIYVEDNFRLISYDFNLCWLSSYNQNIYQKYHGYPAYSEIVLMRPSEDSFCE